MWRKLVVMAAALAALAIVVVPAAAQEQPNNVVWRGTYYNSADLTGDAVFVREDPAIAFNWGAGAPAIGVTPDNFSVRWATDVFLPAGTYRFSALADDNIRVIVDYQLNPLINTWGQGRVGQLVTGDIYLNTGVHHIQVDYSEYGGEAFAFLDFNLAGAAGVQQPNFPAPVSNPVTGGIWTAQYYGNQNLAGSPTLIQTEADITNDWGHGSPAASIPANHWSARWSSVQTLDGGRYQLNVRADDGVRVYVDGVLVINEWHIWEPGATYTEILNLTPGQHSFLVEYYEDYGSAFIEYRLAKENVLVPSPIAPGIPATPIPSPTGLTATVDTSRLNVRAQPDPVNGRILTIISRGETYPILETLPTGTWAQINVNGVIGWVNTAYIDINNQLVAPVVPDQPLSPTGYVVTANPYAVNIRTGPGLQYQRIATLPEDATAAVIGRNAAGTWWQIRYNNVSGWVSAAFARIQTNADLSRIPVTG